MQLVDGRYELLEVIASGGMASVWRAHDTRLGRDVALKRPHPNPERSEGSAADKRMRREATAAAGLSHPNLVTIYDYGTDDDGPYLVMELLDGPTLQEHIGDTHAEKAVALGAQLADGLAAIHEAGIVHRDVKPANVVMSTHGPQLTDFGIATDPALVGDITDPGHVVATPSYAAPEVLRGEEPTPASDVYSLATLIDELISGSGVEVDARVRGMIDSARAASPADRPSAVTFAAALRSVAPTLTRPVGGGGSTMVLEAAPSGAFDTEPTEESRSRRPIWAASILALAAVGLVIAGLALAGDDPDANATPSPVQPADSTTTTVGPTTTTASFATTTTTAFASQADDVQAVRDEFEALLLEPPRSDLNPSEVDDLMKKVDEAVVLAMDGESKKAEKKLSEVAKQVGDKVDGESRDEALDILGQIADVLGIEFEGPGEADDD